MNDNQYSNYNKSDGLVRIAKSAPLTTVLALINIFIFVLLEIGGSTEDLEYMVNHGALYAPFVAEGQYFRLFTSMFLHFGIKHIASNMLALFCLGSVVEQELGEIKYISLYIISGISASAVSCLSAILSGSQTVAAGASGAIFGIIGGLCIIMIKRRGHFRNMNPANVALMAGYSLFAGFTDVGVDNAAHIGGLIMGLIITAITYHPHFDKEREGQT